MTQLWMWLVELVSVPKLYLHTSKMLLGSRGKTFKRITLTEVWDCIILSTGNCVNYFEALFTLQINKEMLFDIYLFYGSIAISTFKLD